MPSRSPFVRRKAGRHAPGHDKEYERACDARVFTHGEARPSSPHYHGGRRQTPPHPATHRRYSMRGQRFGRKIKPPSTMAIKHQLLTMMFEDEIRAIPPGGVFKENDSPALASLNRLMNSPSTRRPD